MNHFIIFAFTQVLLLDDILWKFFSLFVFQIYHTFLRNMCIVLAETNFPTQTKFSRQISIPYQRPMKSPIRPFLTIKNNFINLFLIFKQSIMSSTKLLRCLDVGFASAHNSSRHYLLFNQLGKVSKKFF